MSPSSHVCVYYSTVSSVCQGSAHKVLKINRPLAGGFSGLTAAAPLRVEVAARGRGTARVQRVQKGSKGSEGGGIALTDDEYEVSVTY